MVEESTCKHVGTQGHPGRKIPPEKQMATRSSLGWKPYGQRSLAAAVRGAQKRVTHDSVSKQYNTTLKKEMKLLGAPRPSSDSALSPPRV